MKAFLILFLFSLFTHNTFAATPGTGAAVPPGPPPTPAPPTIKRCNSRTCRFKCTNLGECQNTILICSTDVEKCVLDCKDSGCKDATELKSHATRTYINCNAKDSCVGAKFHCGNLKQMKLRYSSCNLSCGVVGCKEAQLTCVGSFKEGCFATSKVSEDGFTDGKFTCNIGAAEKCGLHCDGNDCFGVKYHCSGPHCKCAGTGCTPVKQIDIPLSDAFDPSSVGPAQPVSPVVPAPVTGGGGGGGGATQPNPVQAQAVYRGKNLGTVYSAPYVQIHCKDKSCQRESPIYCGESVKTCIINCHGLKECGQETKIYSFAQTTVVNCVGDKVCKGLELHCGDSHRRPGIIGKYIGCYTSCNGPKACQALHMQCNGDFSLGCGLTIPPSTKPTWSDGSFECNIQNYGTSFYKDTPKRRGKCRLKCEAGSCKNSQFRCSGFDCLCSGITCPRLKKVASLHAAIFTYKPTVNPTNHPTKSPTKKPTKAPTTIPTHSPTTITLTPTKVTRSPTEIPTKAPTSIPTSNPTRSPTSRSLPPTGKTDGPTTKPTIKPTRSPSSVTTSPTLYPTNHPSVSPTAGTRSPSDSPTVKPTPKPTPNTFSPTESTRNPSLKPTIATKNPSTVPTEAPTKPRGMPLGFFCKMHEECESKNCAVRMTYGTVRLGICVYSFGKCFPLYYQCRPFLFQCCSGECRNNRCSYVV